jgi:hypothetical protein
VKDERAENDVLRTAKEAAEASLGSMKAKLETKNDRYKKYKTIANRVRKVADVLYPTEELKGEAGLRDTDNRWCQWLVDCVDENVQLKQMQAAIRQLAVSKGIPDANASTTASLDFIAQKLNGPARHWDVTHSSTRAPN